MAEKKNLYVDYVIKCYDGVDIAIKAEAKDNNALYAFKLLRVTNIRQEFNRLYDYLKDAESELDELVKRLDNNEK